MTKFPFDQFDFACPEIKFFESTEDDRFRRFEGLLVDAETLRDFLYPFGWQTPDLCESSLHFEKHVEDTLAFFELQIFNHYQIVNFHFDRNESCPVPLKDVPGAFFSEVLLEVAGAVAAAQPAELDSTVVGNAWTTRKILSRMQDQRNLVLDFQANVVRLTGQLNHYQIDLHTGVVLFGNQRLYFEPAWISEIDVRPFSDYDDHSQLTIVIASLVMMLADDSQISQPDLLAQLKRDESNRNVKPN